MRAAGLKPSNILRGTYKIAAARTFRPGRLLHYKTNILWNGLLVVDGAHIGNELDHLVGVAALVVLSLSAKDPFKHLKTRCVRYNSHIIWDKVYSQDISQILSCFL